MPVGRVKGPTDAVLPHARTKLQTAVATKFYTHRYVLAREFKDPDSQLVTE